MVIQHLAHWAIFRIGREWFQLIALPIPSCPTFKKLYTVQNIVTGAVHQFTEETAVDYVIYSAESMQRQRLRAYA